MESSNGTGLLGKIELVKVFVGFVSDQDVVHKRSLILCLRSWKVRVSISNAKVRSTTGNPWSTSMISLGSRQSWGFEKSSQLLNT